MPLEAKLMRRENVCHTKDLILKESEFHPKFNYYITSGQIMDIGMTRIREEEASDQAFVNASIWAGSKTSEERKELGVHSATVERDSWRGMKEIYLVSELLIYTIKKCFIH